MICKRCILDNTVADITFNEQGICNYCDIYDRTNQHYPRGRKGINILLKEISKVKQESNISEYDCIVGVSGGVDSTFTLYLVKKIFKLNPLAVHFDNGWNSEIAVANIKNSTEILDVDLYTHVADWQEFRDLQLSFLKASVSDADIPTDYAIYSVLMDVASNEKIKYIFEGHSFRAEGTVPKSWTYMDGKYIRAVHSKFGKKQISSFPIMSIEKYAYYLLFRRIKHIRPLEYLSYTKEEAKDIISKELKWKDYGGHHHESGYTKFFQSFYLPTKFSIDKRKVSLSASILSGKIKRSEALKVVAKDYPYQKEDINYVLKKLGISEDEFKKFLASPIKSYEDYDSYSELIKLLRYPLNLASKFGLVPKILYEKYSK